jgi:hypothetical protein
MPIPNGETEPTRDPLELSDVLSIETREGTTLPFEVVGILEDEEEVSYAVLRHEAGDDEDDFIVTDLQGNLVEDESLAQDILDDFLAFADEDENRSERNGETG